MSQSETFQEQEWLVSTFRSLKEYISTGFDQSIQTVSGSTVTNHGLEVYEISFDFDSASVNPRELPFRKTLVHFAIDDFDNQPAGFGRTIVREEIIEPTVSTPGTITEHEAIPHTINFDIGVWASAESGGSTSRLKAWQTLTGLLVGPTAVERCLEETQGVKIMQFNNGRFVPDKINDLTVFRVVGGELVVKVWGVEPGDPAVLIDNINSEGNIYVDEIVVIDT